jgi:hypothetical protein
VRATEFLSDLVRGLDGRDLAYALVEIASSRAADILPVQLGPGPRLTATIWKVLSPWGSSTSRYPVVLP